MTRGGQVPRPGWRFLRAWTFWRRALLTRRSWVARRFCILHHRSTWRAVQRRARGEKRRGGGLGELGGEGRCKLIFFFQVSVSGCFLVFLHSASKPGKAGYACCGRHFGSEHCWQLHIGFIARYTKACEKVMWGSPKNVKICLQSCQLFSSTADAQILLVKILVQMSWDLEFESWRRRQSMSIWGLASSFPVRISEKKVSIKPLKLPDSTRYQECLVLLPQAGREKGGLDQFHRQRLCELWHGSSGACLHMRRLVSRWALERETELVLFLGTTDDKINRV